MTLAGTGLSYGLVAVTDKGIREWRLGDLVQADQQHSCLPSSGYSGNPSHDFFHLLSGLSSEDKWLDFLVLGFGGSASALCQSTLTNVELSIDSQM